VTKHTIGYYQKAQKYNMVNVKCL